MSFHATKVYNTIEGGAIVCHDADTKKRIDQLKNFGFVNEITVVTPGINAKMNEMQSAMGLLQLKHIDDEINKRRILVERYREELSNTEGIGYLNDLPNVKHCYSYFPITVEFKRYGKTRDDVYEHMKKHNIFSRRYFYPLISQFPTYRGLESSNKGNLVVAEKIAEEVICLPLYSNLSENDQSKIINSIKHK